ncbi:protein kinase [Chlamydiales bacterium]|nr:protein kinase [Chlamydiales bacterium]
MSLISRLFYNPVNSKLYSELNTSANILKKGLNNTLHDTVMPPKVIAKCVRLIEKNGVVGSQFVDGYKIKNKNGQVYVNLVPEDEKSDAFMYKQRVRLGAGGFKMATFGGHAVGKGLFVKLTSGIQAKLKNERSFYSLLKGKKWFLPELDMTSKKKNTIKIKYCDRGDLSSTPGLTKKEALHLIEGVVYLHDQGITHNDLKPGNILRHEGELPYISDFDGAYKKGQSVTIEDLCGAIVYTSPEMLKAFSTNDKAPLKDPFYYGSKRDAFSLGLLLYEHYILKENKITRVDFYQLLPSLRDAKEMEYRLKWEKMDHVHPDLYPIKMLMHPDHEKRWTPKEALEKLSASQVKG